MSKEDLIPYNSKTASEAGKKSKRGKSLKTIIRDINETILRGEDPLTGIDTEKSVIERLMLKLAAQGISGDVRAAKEYLDRSEGQSEQTVTTKEVIIEMGDEED